MIAVSNEINEQSVDKIEDKIPIPIFNDKIETDQILKEIFS